MIINQNKSGIAFEASELTWKVNDEQLFYDEILSVVNSNKGCKKLSVGSPDGMPYICETEVMDWELDWGIWVFRDTAQKKYGISSYIYASPCDWFDEFEEASENENFEEVARAINIELANSGYKVDIDDHWAEMEGAYTGLEHHARFDTLKEAFGKFPEVFDNLYNVIEAKGHFIRRVIEHYEE
ncbi:hypothetical protein A7W90_05715 [Clostridium sp. Bc-iso-3]|uniref:Uncharacterized protein n=1 Tax=Desulfitobacterium dehalogenans TaxID=36854 RepID=A0A7C6Z7H1_9FIRM|nr:hypothetical protein A7W90_05715 [Clostridium sp. Bc-iso-3]HHY29068.1 hypothetical protein [Desulfitobacterium dehalogenans]